MPTTSMTSEQRRTFDTNGFLVLPRYLATEAVDQLRGDADTLLIRLLTRMAHEKTVDPRITWWRLASGRVYVLKIKPVVDLAPTAAAVATSADLLDLISELLGGSPHLMEDKFMYKQQIDLAAPCAGLPVLGEEVCKHTDAAYFRARGYGRVVTVAICLDDCTKAAGALRVWPGSHRKDIAHIPTVTQGPVVPDHAAPDEAAVTLESPAGSVLIWDSALVHASGPNTSGRPRRLLVLGYSGDDPSPRG